MAKQWIGVVAAMAGLLAVPVVQAADSGWYAGASIGQSRSKNVDLAIIDDGSFTSQSDDRSDTAWKLFGGYRLSRHWAVEGGWVDLGKISGSAVSDGTGSVYNAGAVTGEAEGRGLFLAGVGSLPVTDRISLSARAGLFHWKAKGQRTNSAFGTYRFKDTGTDYLYGVGASYRMSRSVTWRLDLENYHFKDVNNSGIDADIRLVSLGAALAF